MTPEPMTPPADPLAPGATLLVDGEAFLQLRDVDQLPPFLMSVVSDADHWLYVSSRGGLTAGRVSPAGALFPYVTDDQLHTCHPHTGPFTLLRVATPAGPMLWEPFRRDLDGGTVQRHLAKSVLGNQVQFEEVHHGLGLTFSYRWETSDAFGFVRTATLHNQGTAPVALELLDGLLDLMPAGVPLSLQQGASCLVNAYTRAEVDAGTRLGLVALQALIVDQAVPAESLRTTTVFCTGLPRFEVLLSLDQLPAFRQGRPVHPEALLKGRRGAYVVKAPVRLGPGEALRWRLVADVERDHLQVEALRTWLGAGGADRLDEALTADIRRGSAALRKNVGSADGLQRTGDERVVAHHYANVLFNNMRGGVFVSGHQLPWSDFAAFLGERNRPLRERLGADLGGRTGETTVAQLVTWARGQGDPDLVRLAHEYLPLFFSRRHGDPSRPWNAFAIRLRHADGSRALDYQGNWRDIFQNWEALCRSHPDFLESVIALFVDASTADGFNPYRLSRAGIDWEAPEEGNPWANIGYWGDHQIVYLGRLLEASAQHHPGALQALLGQRWFVYADVPYRLKSAAQLVADPRDTILFDHAAEKRTLERVARLGGDGKLLHDAQGQLVRVTLLEKLLVPVLAKLANLVLDGGIWMNTQRPEWNDANNALVGDGLSVVTACQLRRHLVFLQGLLEGAGDQAVELSTGVATWLRQTLALLERHRGLLARARATDGERRTLLDALQLAFEAHRQRLATTGPGAPLPVAVSEAAALCRVAVDYLDHTLQANQRPDRLYHSYNLLGLAGGVATVAPLYEMLEGQVAVLGSGLLTGAEALGLLEAMFESRLYRPDQHSFLLYPDRQLAGFLEKNRLPDEEAAANPLLTALLAQGDRTLVARDVRGQVRFAGHLQTAAAVHRELERLGQDPRHAGLVAAHGAAVEEAFARLFDLRSFTGRSGTMYGYEGLGCIYWHMVSKLLLAVQEVHAEAVRRGDAPELVHRLALAYHRVRDGLGFNKSAREFGAFPTDPYSHTPGHSGAQQPGMTGLVKEELLTRLGELGVEVREGRVAFRPTLLRRREVLTAPAAWEWFDAAGTARRQTLEAGELGFTLCQTPIVYRLGPARALQVRWASGEVTRHQGSELDLAASTQLLGRQGGVAEVVVSLRAEDLLAG